MLASVTVHTPVVNSYNEVLFFAAVLLKLIQTSKTLMKKIYEGAPGLFSELDSS